MSRALIITAIVLIVAGVVLFTVVMSLNGWDLRKLATVNLITNEHVVSESFTNISIDTSTSDIVFALSDNGKCMVICHEDEKEKHSVTVSEGTLTVTVESTKKWYEHIGITAETPKITIYLPDREYTSLRIDSTTTDVIIQKDFSFTSAEISVTTGDIRISETSAESLTVSVTTGDIELENVIVRNKLSVKGTTGDVTFNGCDAGEIFVKLTTGDVKGTLLSEKTFTADTTTGNIDVPKSASGGKCEIHTTTGDIKIEYAK